ncbi:MAG: FAD-dependent oxidoreductase [Planctomycetota bacterium]
MSITGLHYFLPSWVQPADETLEVDLCVYGGNASGVVAAVKASRLGLSTVLLQPGQHLGGMTTGGLGWTDFGRKHVIGGMARDFYRRIGVRKGVEEEWAFWPSEASAVVDELIAEAGIDVRLAQYLDAVAMDGPRIVAITLLGGLTVRAKCFVDASYEGDLLARAGVSYHVGRESNATYGETLNGVQCMNKHQFSLGGVDESNPVHIDPFVVAGDPASGLLPGVEARDLRKDAGQADRKVQAYNFRVCMTDDPDLKIDWQAPAGYDPRLYELAVRWFAHEPGPGDWSGSRVYGSDGRPQDRVRKFDVLSSRTPSGHRKTDSNNHGPVSSDFIGANYLWPEADYAVREVVFQRHVAYQRGLYYFMANDDRLPEDLRRAYGVWGLPKDEFVDTDHWPHQLYPREARRMVAELVVTEADCRAERVADDSVGMGSYTMDSHNCSRFVGEVDGKPSVMNEGDVQVPPTDPYPVSYRAIVPARGECANLVVPVCFSASHIAYGSARMEPVFMVLGESAACAASLAIHEGVDVQDVAYGKLRSMLDDAGQVLG